MRYESPLLVVRDLSASLAFYREILEQQVRDDFGANVVLDCGVSLQTEESWAAFLGKTPGDLTYGGGVSELYFVEEDFDGFLKRLSAHPEAALAHPPLEHRWGQRAVRLYDPDRHIIEVAEPLGAVARRFRQAGLTEDGVAKRMDIPLEMAKSLLRP